MVLSPNMTDVFTEEQTWILTHTGKPRREALEEDNTADTLISDNQPLQLSENIFLFKQSRLWYFLMAAGANRSVL